MSSLAAGQGSDIIQLAAVSGGHSFNLYVIPQCSLQPNAAKVTGSGLHRGQLYLQHQLIPTNSLQEVFHHLPTNDPSATRQPQRLPFRRPLAGTGPRQAGPQGAVWVHCVDTVTLAREMLRGRHLKNFRQETLVKELLGMNYRADDALQDLRTLQALFGALEHTAEMICRHTLSVIETRATANCKVGVKQQRRPVEAVRADIEKSHRDPTGNF